jgi:hypothetical protein
MRRSEINRRIADAEAFFEAASFRLPPWSRRRPDEWRGRRSAESEIFERMLGWDLTDFGSGDFDRVGLVLFTLRNGAPGGGGAGYAEKAMIVGEGQETPLHFHWSKTEDIIVRWGGRLVMRLWASTPEGGLSGESVRFLVDGALRELPAGGTLSLSPGESVRLVPEMYHSFRAEPGRGRVLAGEVSSSNDDLSDNRFYEPAGRFPEVDEDAEPYRLLVSDYPRFAD